MKLKFIFYIFLSFSISLSCSCRNENVITKFIFIKGIELSFDSLEKPQFGLVKYFEYSPTGNIKIAVGKRFRIYPDFEKAPAFGLNEFFEAQRFDSVETIINNILIGKTYDSIYSIDVTEGHYYNYFIFETSNGIIKEILYYDGALPKELDSLDRFVNSLFVTKKLAKTEKFTVNPLVNELQNKLFKKFPPPPLPPNPAELPQRVKFVPQKNNNLD